MNLGALLSLAVIALALAALFPWGGQARCLPAAVLILAVMQFVVYWRSGKR